MRKIYYLFLATVLAFLMSCGTPNEPESIIGGDGGYKIVSRFATSGYAQDVIIKDSLAYISQGQGGLMLINISDPVHPEFVSELTYGLRGYSYKLASKDNVIYLAAGTFGVNTVDISDPLNPILTQEDRPIAPAKNFHVHGQYLFTAVSEEGINITKLTDPSHPDIRQTFFVPGYAQAAYTSADGNYLLIACGEVSFTIFDISDFQDGYNIYPVVAWLDTPGYAEDVVAHPTLPIAFLACGTGGFFIIDYSDSTDVKIKGSYPTGGYAKEIVYLDNKVYVSTGLRGVQIFDVSNLGSPVRLATIPTEHAMGLTVDQKYIYVADEVEGLIIISIP